MVSARTSFWCDICKQYSIRPVLIGDDETVFECAICETIREFPVGLSIREQVSRHIKQSTGLEELNHQVVAGTTTVKTILLISELIDEVVDETFKLLRINHEAKFKEVKDAANWVLHVANNVGKSGEPPEDGEYEASLNNLKKSAGL